MASPANQQQEQTASNDSQQTGAASASHNLVMQRQQQELVRLLAQHFHHQFYQLAANNGGSHLSGTTTSIPSTTANSNLNSNIIQTNSRLHPTLPQPPLSVYQPSQPPGAHYTNETSNLLGSGGSGGGFDLNGMNLVANANNQMLHNHIIRSQASQQTDHHLDNLLPAPGASSASVQDSLIDFSLRNSLNPYPLNDMNLFHALGLNLTNNQLVLSLQQQHQQQQQQQKSLVHQHQTNSTPDRQYEAFRNELGCEDDGMLIGQTNRQSNSSQLIDQTEDNNDHHHHPDGKEMLKFSINTILGRNVSPIQSAGFESLKKGTNAISTMSRDVVRGKVNSSSFSRQANELFKIKRDSKNINIEDERLSAADDCDSNDSSCSDDSSLINASTTPVPTQTNNSILFNQSSPPDRPSAHLNNINNNNNTLATSNQLPRGNTNQLQINNQHHLHNNHHHHHPALPFLPGSSAFPWTVAARGKPRRGMMRRAVFSDSQRVGLEKRFQQQKYISKPDRKKLAEKLGLRDSQVKIWFQNRRMKWRNSKERELLSAGGSREQTLPTRNNPNPDLSDVGETIKRLTSTTTTSSNNNSTTTTGTPVSNNDTIPEKTN